MQDGVVGGGQMLRKFWRILYKGPHFFMPIKKKSLKDACNIDGTYVVTIEFTQI